MGWQGEVHRRKELERIARHFGVSWQSIRVRCFGDNDRYHVTFLNEHAGHGTRRLDRRTLQQVN